MPNKIRIATHFSVDNKIARNYEIGGSKTPTMEPALVEIKVLDKNKDDEAKALRKHKTLPELT